MTGTSPKRRGSFFPKDKVFLYSTNCAGECVRKQHGTPGPSTGEPPDSQRRVQPIEESTGVRSFEYRSPREFVLSWPQSSGPTDLSKRGPRIPGGSDGSVEPRRAQNSLRQCRAAQDSAEEPRRTQNSLEQPSAAKQRSRQLGTLSLSFGIGFLPCLGGDLRVAGYPSVGGRPRD